MLLSSLISSLILLESREVGQSMLSQPFLMSIILIFLGFNPHYVLLTATATHLYFIHYNPSGASKYPEYPFAFFIVISSSKPIFDHFGNNITILILISFVLILIFSRITAHYVYLKRKCINKFTFRFSDTPKEIKIRHYMILSILLSFITGIAYAFILIFFSSFVIEIFSGLLTHTININNLLVVILIAIFIPYFFRRTN